MKVERQREMVVAITLRDYWHETITRDEALRRIESREIEPKRRAEIIKEIPKRTEHFLTFDNGALREYAFSGEGTAALLLCCRSTDKATQSLCSFQFIIATGIPVEQTGTLSASTCMSFGRWARSC